jgi:hypothetical protein
MKDLRMFVAGVDKRTAAGKKLDEWKTKMVNQFEVELCSKN